MLGERQTRALLAPVDPARDVPVPGPSVSAHDLIVRAEQQPAELPRRTPRIGRRLVLASVGAVLAATAVVAVHDRVDPASAPTAHGVVVRPIAFVVADGPPGTGKHLRELADRIGDAPWDTMTGPYTYHRIREWGTFGVGADDDRYHKAAVDEHASWSAADGTGRWVWKHLPPEYRDEASRAFFEAEQDILDGIPDSQGSSAPWNRPALPSGTAALAAALDLANPIAVPHRLTKLYADYAIPRKSRADLLRILAGLPGYSWRGAVVDRAGRAGVAVTYRPPDAPGYQQLLIFDPVTGAVLAHEETSTQNGRTYVDRYVLILDTRLTTTTR